MMLLILGLALHLPTPAPFNYEYSFLHLFIYMKWSCLYRRACMEVRRKSAEVFHLLGFPGSNSSCQAWWQMPLAAKQSYNSIFGVL